MQPRTAEVFLTPCAVFIVTVGLLSLGCSSVGTTRETSACGGPPDTRPDRVTRATGSYDGAARTAFTGGVVVRLTDLDTGRGVAGARVEVWAGDRVVTTPLDSAAARQGVFTFPWMPAGYYVVRTMRLGYSVQTLMHQIEPGRTDTIKIAWLARKACPTP